MKQTSIKFKLTLEGQQAIFKVNLVQVCFLTDGIIPYGFKQADIFMKKKSS